MLDLEFLQYTGKCNIWWDMFGKLKARPQNVDDFSEDAWVKADKDRGSEVCNSNSACPYNLFKTIHNLGKPQITTLNHWAAFGLSDIPLICWNLF